MSYPDYDNNPDVVIVRNDNPPRRTGGLWVALILVVAAAVGGWVWYASRPTPVTVVKRDINGQIPLAGEIITPPSARADIAAPFRAPVEKVFVSVGKSVSKGDPLVQLSVPNAAAYIEQAHQAMLTAETAYANAKNQAEGPVNIARQNLVNAQAAESAARPSPTTTVHPDGSSTTVIPSTGGQPLSARVAAEHALAQAEANRDAQIGTYKTQLDLARATYQEAKSGAKLGLIRAPLDGTVLAINAQPGQEVGKDAKVPVATVVDLSAIQAQAQLDQQQSAAVKQGMPVAITFAELPNQTFNGTVSRITSKVDEKLGGLVKDNKFVALIDFKNHDALAKPGMKPMIALKTGDAKNALVVPSEAIDVVNGAPTIKVQQGGNWQQIPVEVGVSDGKFTQIKSGVKEGDTVQVTPNVLNAATLNKK